MRSRAPELTPEQWETLRQVAATILRQGFGCILISSSDSPPDAKRPPACLHMAAGGREVYALESICAGSMIESLFLEHGEALGAKQKTENGRLAISEANRRRHAEARRRSDAS